MIRNIFTIIVCLVVLALLYTFVIPNLARAAPTMENDTESIALPTIANDKGEHVIIYDNPQLIREWAQGANDPYADFLTSTALALTPAADGSVTVSVGSDESAATADALLATIGPDAGFTFTVVNQAGNVASNSGTATIVISGSKLREALVKKGILSIMVRGWDFDDTAFLDDEAYYWGEASVSTSDVAVIAAAAVFRDQNIETVSLSGQYLNISYRTKGWLFGFIPIRFTVHLSMNAGGTTDEARVSVRFPWYRFFTWLTLSPNALARDLNAAILGNQAAGLDPTESQARLFTQVTALLRAQSATDVSGLPPQ
jgi:hypothetical protein